MLELYSPQYSIFAFGCSGVVLIFSLPFFGVYDLHFCSKKGMGSTIRSNEESKKVEQSRVLHAESTLPS